MPVDITPQLVRNLIASEFPEWADLAIESVPVDGWDNRTFRLGDEMSVRLPSAQEYTEQVAKEQRWLPVLAPHMTQTIPTPLEVGAPACGYPWHWSVYRWIDGETATVERIRDLGEFAGALGRFLLTLQHVDPTGAPAPGEHNFYRGAHLSVYDEETRGALAALTGSINVDAAARVWDAALNAPWSGPPVWLHGDMSASNLIVRDGRLYAVIDFGSCGVGDPSCDLTIAWTFLTASSRELFFTAVGVDASTRARARGWALWKALITLAQFRGVDQSKAPTAARVFDDVLEDHAATLR